MAYEKELLTEEDVPEDASEAQEADGVAKEMGAPELTPEEAAELDRQTLEALADDERAELEAAAEELGQPEVLAERAHASLRLSANFVLAEFHCCRGHCAMAFVPAAATPALRRLVREVLQPLRDEFGRCSVHSGYRNTAHNSHVGGEDNSRHQYHRFPSQVASDVSFVSGSVDQWAAAARRHLGDVGGVGRYPSQRFVHVDLGPLRHWNG
jgi:hypothetical protein